MGQTQIATPARGQNGKFVPRGVASQSSSVAVGSVMNSPRIIGLHEVISNDYMKFGPRVRYVLVNHGMVFINHDSTRSGMAFPSQVVPCAGQTLVQRALRDLHALFGLQDYEYRSDRFIHLGQFFGEENGALSLSVYVGVPVTRYVGGAAGFFDEFEWANSPMMAKFPFTENERVVIRAAKKERLIA